MATFNAVAKLTHARYGTNNHPATGLTRQKATVVPAIASHSSTMFTSAQPIWCIPKNTGDHVAFNANCTAHHTSTPLQPTRQKTNHAATDIITYNAVQTGPNSQLGGVQTGLAMVGYHSRTEFMVVAPPSPATAKLANKNPPSTSVTFDRTLT